MKKNCISRTNQDPRLGFFLESKARSFKRLKDRTSKYIKESVDIWSEVLWRVEMV